MKKIINALLCTALLVSNLTAVSYAEELDKNNYTTIDISNVANAPIYAKEGDRWSENYVATAPSKGYGIDLDTMKNQLTNGQLINNGTPYDITVETGKNTAINTGGRTSFFYYTENGINKGVTNQYNYTGTDIDVADGYYSSLKILASAAGDFAKEFLQRKGITDIDAWLNSSKLAVVMQYADGTSEVLETLTTNPVDYTKTHKYNSGKTNFPKDAAGVAAPKMPNGDEITSENYWNGFNVKIITNYGTAWKFGGAETYSAENTGSGDYFINEYTFPVDNTKVLKSVHVVGASADYDGVRLKSDGTVDYATYNVNQTRYYANMANKDLGHFDGMYSSMVYAMTAVTKDSDLKSLLSARLNDISNAETVEEADVAYINTILEQAKTIGADLGETGKKAQAVIEQYNDVQDSKVTVYEKIDIKPYANQAAYAKVGDTVYDKQPTIGNVYMTNTLAELNESGAYPKAYIKTGISIDHFKYFSNENGVEPKYYNNWTDISNSGEKSIPSWGTWETGKTTNTLTFRDIPYLMNVETNAYTNIDTGAADSKMKGVDVDINDGYYKELKILSTASNPVLQNAEEYKNWNNMSKLALKLDYADGSYDVVDYMVNEQAAQHSLAIVNSKIIENIKTNNTKDRNSDDTAVRTDPKTPKITSYDKDGQSEVKQQSAELTQEDWWNGFAAWSISAQKLESDWESKFGSGSAATYPCSLWYQTNKDILATLNSLTDEQRETWINGTTPRYKFGAAAGAKAGINVFTVPVDNSKVLVNVHFVGSLASNDGVQVDENGNVIYSPDNAIANGSGAYNNSIWAITAVTTKKDVKTGFKTALNNAQNAGENVTAEMIADLKGAYAQMIENSYEIDNDSLSAYTKIINDFGVNMKAKILSVSDSQAFIELFDKYLELGYFADDAINTKRAEFYGDMPAYLYSVSVGEKSVSAKLKSFTESEVSGVLIAAVYDANGNMLECKVENNAVSGNAVHTLTFDSSTEDRKVKLFALNNFVNIEPLAVKFAN